MKKGNFVIAGIFSILAILIIILSLHLPHSREGVPGPGTWPILISVVMLVASITIGIKAFSDSNEVALEIRTPDTIRVYVSMAVLIVYLLAMYYIGFCISSFLLLYGLITWFSSYKWFQRVGISFIVIVVVYLLFSHVFNVPFRFGILF